MGNSTTMTYGDYSFSPVPFLDITKSYLTTGDSNRIGTTTTVNVNGILTPLPTGIGGYVTVDAFQDNLRNALATDGQRFLVQCGGTTLIDTYPRVNGDLSFTPSNDNWVQTTPFSFSFQWDDEPVGVSGSGEDPTLMPPYVETASESWEVEFDDSHNKFSWAHSEGGTTDEGPTVMRLTHTLSAKGKRHFGFNGLDKQAWQQAQTWVIGKLGYDETFVTGSGVMNLTAASFVPFNHVRSQQVDETDGTFNVSESWIVTESGSNILASGNQMAFEDYNTSVNTSLEGNTSISVQGTIVGLEDRSYGTNPGDYSVVRNKFDNAMSYWTAVSGRLYNRAATAAVGLSAASVNIVPMTKVIGYNPKAGSVNYSYNYNDRPCNFVAGSRSEQIIISDESPIDVFASLTVLGRARGPVLQSMNTITTSKRNVNINVVMNPPVGCTDISVNRAAAPTADVDALLCSLQTELTNTYDKVFKTQDSATWDIKTGNYSRNVGWEFASCTGTIPTTTLC